MSGLLLLLLNTSAAPAETPPPPPIVNGELEEGFPEAVAIGAIIGDNTFSACTGTLITPRLILTAAHCGSDLPVEAIVALGTAFFGADIAAPDATLRFEDYVVHPDYVPLDSGTTLGENDVSVLVLEEDADVEPAWVRLDAFSEEEVQGESVISVGFGATEDGTADGRKRSAELTIDELDEVFLISRSLTNPGSANICSGDSGGPQLFIDEEGRSQLWAVHSWGDTTCRRESGSTRTDIVTDWLTEQILAFHGTDDLCEAAGRYDDGVCDDDLCDADPDCDVAAEEEPKGGCATAPTPRRFAPALLLFALLLPYRRR